MKLNETWRSLVEAFKIEGLGGRGGELICVESEIAAALNC